MILPIAEAHLPIYHSEQHYPVIVKTEDLPAVTGPVVISEERPPVKPQTVADDNLPAQREQQSYEQEVGEETLVQEESVDRDAEVRDQEQRDLPSQEEITSTAPYQPGNVEEQTQEEENHDEQIQEEQIRHKQIQQGKIQHEQIQEEQFQHEQRQDEQIQQELSDAPLPDQEQFTTAEDSSEPWMQESAPGNVQQSDEFYTPEEQVIPQSHTYSQEYQEESNEDNEPWVMVDYPPAEEQENYFRPEDSVDESRQEELEVPNEGYVPQEAEEETEYQYYDDEQRMDEEVDEPQPVEVCTVNCKYNEILISQTLVRAANIFFSLERTTKSPSWLDKTKVWLDRFVFILAIKSDLQSRNCPNIVSYHTWDFVSHEKILVNQ